MKIMIMENAFGDSIGQRLWKWIQESAKDIMMTWEIDNGRFGTV